jgi:hypothetical protein
VLVDLIRSLDSLNLDNTAILLKVVDDGHAGLDKGSETLADTLLVVISSATGLAAVDQTLLHDLFGALKEQSEDALADGLFKLDGLVHLAGETVDEELVGAVLLDGGLHGVFEQLDGDFHGDNLAVADVLLDQVAELAALTVLLFAQKVAGGEVLELVVADDVAALSALAGTGTTQDEDDSGLTVGGTGGEERLVAVHGGDGREVCGSHCLVFGVEVGVEFFGRGGLLVSRGQNVVGFALAVSGLCDLVEEKGAGEEDGEKREDGQGRVGVGASAVLADLRVAVVGRDLCGFCGLGVDGRGLLSETADGCREGAGRGLEW